MQVKFWKFTKKENSTKQPSGAAAATFNCRLKDPCSVIDPVITVSVGPLTWPDYNYAYISDFHRYYFVDDIVAVGALFEMHLRCDLLATYKTDIGSASLYVLRSASQYDGNLIDEYYPVKVGVTDVITEATSPWIAGTEINIQTDGCFVVGLISWIPVIGDLTYYPAYGSITYRAFTRANLQKMVNYLLNDAILDNVNGFVATDCSIALQKAIIDPLSFIKSCTWIPVPYTDITTAQETTNTNIWDWTMPGVASKALINDVPYITKTQQIQITKHPDAATRGNYLNIEPYTKLSLFAPPFGILDIDTTLAADETYLNNSYTVDLITGIATMIVKVGTTQTHYLKSQVGVPIQLSQITKDYLGTAAGGIGGFLSAAVGALSGNPLMVFGGAAAMIGSAVNAQKPNVSSIGGSGSFSEVRNKTALIHQFRYPASENLAEVGRPLCQTKTISSLSGYVKALGDVAIAGTSGEQSAVKSLIEGGFFYE